MSLPEHQTKVAIYEGKLLLDESPYQLQPTLAQMLSTERSTGDTEAVFLQQLQYILRHPFYRDTRLPTAVFENRLYVRIEPKMFTDVLDGLIKFIKDRTRERIVARLVERGLLFTNNFNEDRRDTTNWYAINYEELWQQEKAHQVYLDGIRADRQNEAVEIKPRDKRERHRQSGGAKPEVVNEALSTDKVAVLAPTKWRFSNGQSGGSSTDKVAPSSCSTENEDYEDYQQQHGVADVELLSERSEKPHSKRSGKAKPSSQSSLPQTAAVSQNGAGGAADDAQGHERRITAIAERLIGAGFPNAGGAAREQAASFPETHLDDAALLARLTKDYRRAGFPVSVDVPMAQKLVRDGADELRWQLILWPSRPEAGVTFTGNAVGAFVLRVRGQRSPEDGWIRRLAEATHQAAQNVEYDELQAQAQAFWKTLSPIQKETFDRDFKTEWLARFAHTAYNPRDADHLAEFARQLLDERTQTWLASIAEPKDMSTHVAAPPATANAVDPEWLRGIVLNDLRDGITDESGLDAYRHTYWSDVPGAMWQEVKANVIDEWAQEKAA